MARKKVDLLETILAAADFSSKSSYLTSASRENSEIIYIWFWSVSKETKMVYIPFIYRFLSNNYKLHIAQYVYNPEKRVSLLYYE